MTLRPQGELTEAQLEVMEAVWAGGDAGASAAQVWETLSAQRPLARTTVLTMITRLEERGWLKRTAGERAVRYQATRPRQQAIAHLARQFVKSFFGGSTTAFLKSLLGSDHVTPAELKRLRELVQDASKPPRAKAAGGKP